MQFGVFADAKLAVLPVARRTRENYLGAYRRHIEPRFAAKDIATISRQDVLAVLDGLPPQTAYQVLMVLRTLFREALESGVVLHRPTDGVRAPRIRVEQRPFLRWDDVRAASFGQYTDHVYFLALHGLRWSEAVALSEADIREERVFVNRSKHGQTKSLAGVRSVPYLGHFTPFPKDRRTLARVLSPYGVTIHSLRKTYAYLLKTSGVHVSTAQKMLGHASPQVTLSIYTRVLDSEIDDAGELIRSKHLASPVGSA